MASIEESNRETNEASELAARGDLIEARRRKALIDFGIDTTDWPLHILRDEPNAIEPDSINQSPIEEVPEISDAAWNLIAEVFPKPHANQKLNWRGTIDALIKLTQTSMSWTKIGTHSEAIRARLNRSRVELWNEIEQRINGAAIDTAERERITTMCTFARRYLAERDARVNAAPTPTAASAFYADERQIFAIDHCERVGFCRKGLLLRLDRKSYAVREPFAP